ncbi:hypothetical protein JCM21714_1446 [Gracilibacillus boraciitolerans JCM 21714]|uniref:Uncharacterized protein n=1 Tax=Gracilibacillus boraciitolerans JCM 21714 TaxID=1298598 RepID=W4VI75_9BACI|nr:DUF5693 family protein [Gracilibacillus boraciitolerans]GAE92444.1 hypothetical protein JCM21714_1446 [Gracilibacillus boraciitolerans JCM 21714]
MKQKYWLWLIIIILTLLSIPGVLARWNVETGNDTYNTIIPFKEINDLTKEDDLSLEETLTRLHDAGLTTVSFTPDSLAKWSSLDIISKYEKRELEDIVRFHEDADNLVEDKDGFYITRPSEDYYDDKIVSEFHPITINIGTEELYFIDEEQYIEDELKSLGINKEGNNENGEELSDESAFNYYLGYNQLLIEEVSNYGFEYVLRVENTELNNNETINNIIDLKNDDTSSLLFSGGEVIGYPEKADIQTYANRLNEAGFDFYSIEFTYQDGLATLASELDYDVIRLHSMTIESDAIAESVQRAVRAVKERNIRSLFLHIPGIGEASDRLETTEIFLNRLNSHIPPTNYHSGEPEPFQDIEIPIWSMISVLLAGIAFTYLSLEVMKKTWIRITGSIVMALLAGMYLGTGLLASLQAFGLAIALLTAIYATLAAKDGTTTMKGGIMLVYLQAIAISVIGITIMIGVLNGDSFITGFAQFRGVILVYVVPMVFLALWALWQPLNRFYHHMRSNFAAEMKKVVHVISNAQVKYWHLIVLSIVGIGFYYYITRTGNEGVAADVEIIVRQRLEEWLYVRPRTKEFLIGFPLFILATYVIGKHPRFGKYLLIPGSIGFLSIVNTFSHLHIPIYISIIRTGYSLVIGLIIGLILIYIFKWGK